MIVSRQNNLIKRLKALSSKKERAISGTYLAEGENSVGDAVKLGARIVTLLTYPENAEKYLDKGFPVEIAPREIVDYCADSVTPQGVVAEVKIPSPPPKVSGNCVLLDGVSDPGNVGTIIRTCAAVGVKDVLLVSCADAFSPKCVRSSMSGIFSVNIHDVTRERALKLVENKVKIVADMAGENVFSCEVDDFCLIIGSEAHGVSDYFTEKADKIVSLPMRREMESLNAGVSCSVILYTLLKNKI